MQKDLLEQVYIALVGPYILSDCSRWRLVRLHAISALEHAKQPWCGQ